MLKVYDDVGHFHIPKTAGTSFTEDLNKKYGEFQLVLPKKYKIGRHCTLKEVAKIYDITQLEKIYCPVRNPYAVCVSLYFWIRRCINNRGAYLHTLEIHPEILVLLDMDFNDYVLWYINSWNSFEEWMTIDGKIPENVEVIKVEDNTIETHTNESNHEHYSTYYNVFTRVKIAEFDAWAFDRFGYGG